MNTKSKLIFSIAAIIVASSVGAQELSANPKDGAVAGKTRAEVRAEVEVWRQAGLDRYGMEVVDFTSQDYQQRLAEYQRLRSGPAYEAALRRQQDRDTARAVAKAGDTQARTN